MVLRSQSLLFHTRSPGLQIVALRQNGQLLQLFLHYSPGRSLGCHHISEIFVYTCDRLASMSVVTFWLQVNANCYTYQLREFQFPEWWCVAVWRMLGLPYMVENTILDMNSTCSWCMPTVLFKNVQKENNSLCLMHTLNKKNQCFCHCSAGPAWNVFWL